MSRRIAWLASLLLAACVATQPAGHAPTATYVIVRHAEKAMDASADPALSAAGVARARTLARRLAGVRLVAVYSTPFRRTHDTAQPSALLHGLAITTYDAAMPAPAFAALLRASHRSGTVLVVGHSNTVPAIAAALCACKAPALGEDDYDAIYTVRLQGGGAGVLETGRQSR